MSDRERNAEIPDERPRGRDLLPGSYDAEVSR
jgi:hypothetical protein